MGVARGGGGGMVPLWTLCSQLSVLTCSGQLR